MEPSSPTPVPTEETTTVPAIPSLDKRDGTPRVPKMKWDARNDKILLLLSSGREILRDEWELIANHFPEKPTFKALQERMSKLRAEQKQLFAAMGIEERLDSDVMLRKKDTKPGQSVFLQKEYRHTSAAEELANRADNLSASGLFSAPATARAPAIGGYDDNGSDQGIDDAAKALVELRSSISAPAAVIGRKNRVPASSDPTSPSRTAVAGLPALSPSRPNNSTGNPNLGKRAADELSLQELPARKHQRNEVPAADKVTDSKPMHPALRPTYGANSFDAVTLLGWSNLSPREFVDSFGFATVEKAIAEAKAAQSAGHKHLTEMQKFREELDEEPDVEVESPERLSEEWREHLYD